tara:strand:- start:5121 stop:6578 length:1458 start_codon:yes stop_codon:yes gene_type:complete
VSPIKQNIHLTNWEIVSVNPISKNWNWKDIFCLWTVGTQSIISFSLLGSLYFLYNLNFYEVMFGSILASLLVGFLSNIGGAPSQKHGIPFPVFLRISTGYVGAKYISLLRGVVGLFFFGVQTFFISKSIGYLIRISLFNIDNNLLNNEIFLFFFMAMNIIDVSSLIITLVLQYLIFSKGQKIIKNFVNISAFFVYFGLFLFFLIFISESDFYVLETLIYRLNLSDGLSQFKLVNMIGIAGTLFAYYSILILNFGDYSRYVKNKKQLTLGNLSLIFTLILFSFLVLTIVVGSDIYFKSNNITTKLLLTNPTDIIGKINNTILTMTVLIFILFASSSTNLIANYIPSQNIIINFLPKNMTLKKSGLIILFIGFVVGVFWSTLLSQIGSLSILDTIASFFGPIFGVMIIDYYIIKKSNLVNKDIFLARENSAYMYSRGWNLKALYSIFIGTVFAFSTIWNPDLNIFQSFSWIIGFVFSSIVYYLLASE